MYWKVKTFRTKEALNKWIERNKHKVQYEIIFVNNGWGVEYRPLKVIRWDD